MLHFDISQAEHFVTEEAVEDIKNRAEIAKKELVERTGLGSEYCGWIDWPEEDHHELITQMQNAAEQIRNQSEVLVVIGIGGSYLGAAAAIDFLKSYFYNQQKEGLEVYFAGNNISGGYVRDLLRLIGNRDFSVNVVSKSGTTTEPAIAFRIFKQKLIEKYGREDAAQRIYATTDREYGALKRMADAEGYTAFVVPDDIGGRYSVLTAVGLLPIVTLGGDVEALLAGAKAMRERIMVDQFEDNPAMQYAAYRNLFYQQGKRIEMLAAYEPKCRMIGEWWRQLFGESEGKDGKGLFPATYQLTTDLHSIGQYVQDGPRMLFETVLNIENADGNVVVELDAADLDNLNYLEGNTLEFVNQNARRGTTLAHVEGAVPNLLITIDDFSEFSLGELFYFFEFSCAISGYMLGVNPFNQPGVEAYKNNMFSLLGKP